MPTSFDPRNQSQRADTYDLDNRRTSAALIRIRKVFRALLIVVLLTGHAANGRGQSTTELDWSVQVGYAGSWKLGQPCPVRIQLSQPAPVQAAVVRTIDGDGVGVDYRYKFDSQGQESIWLTVRIGRRNADFTVILEDVDGREIAARAIDLEEETVCLESHQPLVLALGSSMGAQELSRTSAGGTASTYSTITLTEPADLPPHWRDYAACDLVVVAAQSPTFVDTIAPEVWHALDQWIQRGGAAVVSVSDSLARDESEETRPWESLLPGTLEKPIQIRDPGALEAMVTTEEPIRPFSAALVNPNRGAVRLSLEDSLSEDVPWWISFAHGQGTIQFIASDLDHPSLSGWSDRASLWSRLLEDYLGSALKENKDEQVQSGESSYLGYRDLVGQLRATLDVFPSVRVLSFGQIVALLLGVILLIGPLDYLVSVKWLKRPEFSWYLATLILLVTSCGFAFMYASLRPDCVLVNTAQVVDIDATNGTTNGRLWSHVYTGGAHRVDVSAALENGQSVSLDWQGLPGVGLGGLLSQLNADRGMPSYSIESVGDNALEFRSVGIPAGGTKCLTGSWIGSVPINGMSALREARGVDQLEGELVNPLQVDIRDAALLYHHWFYRLNSRIPAGGSQMISFEMNPKDLSRKLNDRRMVDGGEAVTRWDPSDRNSLDRLLELMMFHKAASGTTYTNLQHRYQPSMDQSNLLETDYAILVGRLEQPIARVAVTPDNSDLDVRQEVDRVWCRIVIPVQPAQTN